MKKKIQYLDKRIEKEKEVLNQLLNYRLASVGIGFILLVICSLQPQWKMEIPVIIGSILTFIIYFWKSVIKGEYLSKLQELKSFYQRQYERNLQELDINNFIKLDKVVYDQYKNHPLNKDLDILWEDKACLFHQISEANSLEAQQKILELLLEHKLNDNEILESQKTVNKISKELGRFRKFSILLKISEMRSWNAFYKQLQLGTSINWPRNLVYALFLTSYTLILANWFFWKNEVYSFVYLTYVICSWSFLKFIIPQFQKATSLELQLKNILQIYKTLNKCHDNSVYSQICKISKSKKLINNIFKLQKINSKLSIQTHPIVLLFVHAILPWSYFYQNQLMKVLSELLPQLEESFKELQNLEVLGSFACQLQYQEVDFPHINQQLPWNAKKIRHPLIANSKVVKNDFDFHNFQLCLITGSNMAGKSTFLRTVGLNQCLVNAGAACYAKELNSSILHITSCIRVSDSVEYGFSYFYSEVLRLKEVLNQADRNSNCLYLVDEIFKGTNNKERFEGSKAIIQHLSKSDSIGIITTHDLELTQLSDQIDSIENFHFREELDGNKMVFPYKIQEGPCPTTNALLIMKNEGLPV